LTGTLVYLPPTDDIKLYSTWPNVRIFLNIPLPLSQEMMEIYSDEFKHLHKYLLLVIKYFNDDKYVTPEFIINSFVEALKWIAMPSEDKKFYCVKMLTTLLIEYNGNELDSDTITVLIKATFDKLIKENKFINVSKINKKHEATKHIENIFPEVIVTYNDFYETHKRQILSNRLKKLTRRKP
jgi:hypothetical protein